MRCPMCAADDDRVVDSRPSRDGEAIRRRRECQRCAARFTTFERVEVPELLVQKRSRAVVTFRRDKVLDGMARAAKGRVAAVELERAATQVERAVRHLGGPVVTSEQIGLQVLARLRELDPIAYVRFASVYEDFQRPEDFDSLLSTLRKEGPPK